MPRSNLIVHRLRVFGFLAAPELRLWVATDEFVRKHWPAAQGLQVTRMIRPWSRRYEEESIEEHPGLRSEPGWRVGEKWRTRQAALALDFSSCGFGTIGEVRVRLHPTMALESQRANWGWQIKWPSKRANSSCEHFDRSKQAEKARKSPKPINR